MLFQPNECFEEGHPHLEKCAQAFFFSDWSSPTHDPDGGALFLEEERTRERVSTPTIMRYLSGQVDVKPGG